MFEPWNPNLLELAVLIILDGKPFTRPEFFQAEFAEKFDSVAPTSNLHRMLGLTGRRGKLNDGEVCYRAVMILFFNRKRQIIALTPKHY